MTPTVYPNFDRRRAEFIHHIDVARSRRPFGADVLDGLAEIIGRVDGLLKKIGHVSEPDAWSVDETPEADEAAELEADEEWLQPNERGALAYGDWGEPSDAYKASQPYHNDMYPYL